MDGGVRAREHRRLSAGHNRFVTPRESASMSGKSKLVVLFGIAALLYLLADSGEEEELVAVEVQIEG